MGVSHPLTLDGLSASAPPQETERRVSRRVICYTLYLVFKEPNPLPASRRHRYRCRPSLGEPFKVTTVHRYRQSFCRRDIRIGVLAEVFTLHSRLNQPASSALRAGCPSGEPYNLTGASRSCQPLAGHCPEFVNSARYGRGSSPASPSVSRIAGHRSPDRPGRAPSRRSRAVR